MLLWRPSEFHRHSPCSYYYPYPWAWVSGKHVFRNSKENRKYWIAIYFSNLSFWFILQSPEKDNADVQSYNIEKRELGGSSTEEPTSHTESIPTEISRESFATRMRNLISALKYALPLVLVYYFEYVINQGLVREVLYIFFSRKRLRTKILFTISVWIKFDW